MIEPSAGVGTRAHVLSHEILAHCHERAPGYDRGNEFFREDFDDLRAAG